MGTEFTGPLLFCNRSDCDSLRGAGIGLGFSGMGVVGLLMPGDFGPFCCSLPSELELVLLTGVLGGGGRAGILTFRFSEGLVLGGGGLEGIPLATVFTSFFTSTGTGSSTSAFFSTTFSSATSAFLGRGLGAIGSLFPSEFRGASSSFNTVTASTFFSAAFCSDSCLACNCSVLIFLGSGLAGGGLGSLAFSSMEDSCFTSCFPCVCSLLLIFLGGGLAGGGLGSAVTAVVDLCS